MESKPLEVLKELKKKKFSPLYFLHGEEPYYIDLISDYVEKEVLNESEKAFNLTVIYGRDTNISSLLSIAKRYPMLSDYQVVIVKEAQQLSDIGKQDAEKLLEKYIENPVDSTILLFCFKNKPLDKRRSITSKMKEKAVLVTCSKISDYKVVEWINEYVKEKKYSIKTDTSMLLSEYLGNDLNKISNEIDKLCINVPANSEITKRLVEEFTGISRDYNVFELNKALQKKDVFKANQIIDYFVSNPKNNPDIVTISTLYSFFSKVLLYHYLRNKPEGEIATSMGIPAFYISDYAETSRNYSFDKTIKIINFLKEADLRLKGVNYNQSRDGEILKELVFGILH